MLEKRLRQFDQQASSSGQAPPALRVPSAAASDLPPAPKLPSASELPPLPPAASPKPASSPLKAPTGTLNFTLQRALGVTLKKAEAQGGVVYLAAAASELGEVDMALEAVGSVIYARLQASEGTGHPFSFLLHAFNRCEAEARSCRHADVGAALAECRQQLVQYSALLLTVPDFVPASASAGSAKVLADALLASNPTNGVRASYLSLVLAAVAESGDEAAVPDVLAPVVDRLLAQLKAPPGQPAVAAGDVSTRAVKALALLCSTKAAVRRLRGAVASLHMCAQARSS